MNTHNNLKPQTEGVLYGPVLIGASKAFQSLRVHIYLQELVSLANEHERLKDYEKRRAKRAVTSSVLKPIF